MDDNVTTEAVPRLQARGAKYLLPLVAMAATRTSRRRDWDDSSLWVGECKRKRIITVLNLFFFGNKSIMSNIEVNTVMSPMLIN